jgi:Zn-dependent protease with chaperone function
MIHLVRFLEALIALGIVVLLFLLIPVHIFLVLIVLAMIVQFIYLMFSTRNMERQAGKFIKKG